jgi:hypothetical protein
VRGKSRKEMSENFDKFIYGKRNLVETVFSVVKRRFGGYVKESQFRNQVKEIKLKCIAYSADRFLKEQKILCLNRALNRAQFLEFQLRNSYYIKDP